MHFLLKILFAQKHLDQNYLIQNPGGQGSQIIKFECQSWWMTKAQFHMDYGGLQHLQLNSHQVSLIKGSLICILSKTICLLKHLKTGKILTYSVLDIQIISDNKTVLFISSWCKIRSWIVEHCLQHCPDDLVSLTVNKRLVLMYSHESIMYLYCLYYKNWLENFQMTPS